MEGTGIQHFFTEDTIEKYYLSPYAEWLSFPEAFQFGRRERNRQFVWEGDSELVERLFEHLGCGMTSGELLEELSEVVGVEDAQDWHAFLLQEGIIE